MFLWSYWCVAEREKTICLYRTNILLIQFRDLCHVLLWAKALLLLQVWFVSCGIPCNIQGEAEVQLWGPNCVKGSDQMCQEPANEWWNQMPFIFSLLIQAWCMRESSYQPPPQALLLVFDCRGFTRGQACFLSLLISPQLRYLLDVCLGLTILWIHIYIIVT